MPRDLDEIDLAILAIYDMTDEAGVSPAQARVMLRERVEIAGDIADALHHDDTGPALSLEETNLLLTAAIRRNR